VRFLHGVSIAVGGLWITMCVSCARNRTESIETAIGIVDSSPVVNTRVMDLGTIPKGTLIRHRFPILNATDHAVMIKHIKKF
jgi:hypothetical protein